MITYDKIDSDFITETNFGFGNQLFMIASTIGIAVKHGFEFGFRENFPVFKNHLPVCTENYPRNIRIPWGYHVVTPKDNTALYGYMQSEKYFIHCPDLIRHYFELSDGYRWHPLADFDCIAVHVRRGDYEGERHHAVLTKDYYEKALSMMPNLPVMVFSDEPDKAAKMFSSSVKIIRGNSHYTDFAMMCHAKYHIIANSSFSWWPAWLHGEKVIAPSRWFAGNNLKLETKDLYAQNWEVI